MTRIAQGSAPTFRHPIDSLRPAHKLAEMKTRPFSEIRSAAEIISRPLLRLPFAGLALLACIFAPSASAVGAPEQRAFSPIQPRLSPDGQQIALSWQGAICRMPASGVTR